jgi:hypothetical protein
MLPRNAFGKTMEEVSLCPSPPFTFFHTPLDFLKRSLSTFIFCPGSDAAVEVGGFGEGSGEGSGTGAGDSGCGSSCCGCGGPYVTETNFRDIVCRLKDVLTHIMAVNKPAVPGDPGPTRYQTEAWRRASGYLQRVQTAEDVGFLATVPNRGNKYTWPAALSMLTEVLARLRSDARSECFKDTWLWSTWNVLLIDAFENGALPPILETQWYALQRHCSTMDLLREDSREWRSHSRYSYTLSFDFKSTTSMWMSSVTDRRTAVEARVKAIRDATSPEVLRAVETLCADFVANALSRLGKDIEIQLKVSGKLLRFAR